MCLSTCPTQNWELHGSSLEVREPRRSGFRPFVIILRSMFRSFVACSDESGQNQVTGELASPNLLLLRRSLSVQSNFAFHQTRMIAAAAYEIRHSCGHSVYVILPRQSTRFENFRGFLCFWGYFIYFLLAFRKFLEPNRRFILKTRDSDVRDGFIDSKFHENRARPLRTSVHEYTGTAKPYTSGYKLQQLRVHWNTSYFTNWK